MPNVHIISLFPEICKTYFESSVIGRVVKNNLLKVYYYNPIDEVGEKERLDDRPYGGGPGMVLRAKPFLDCFDKAKKYEGTSKSIFLTPAGEQFTQEKAKEYSKYDNLIFFCGRYEGLDERVSEIAEADRVSIGPYTLTGGEIPAMIITDAVARESGVVLGNVFSLEDKRVSGGEVYTRPENLEYSGKEYSVPDVLLSGNHGEIDEYRKEKGGNK